MFRCDLTGELSKPREQLVRVILEERPRTYTNGPADAPTYSVGTEIVKEVEVRLSAIDPDKAARVELSRQPPDYALYRSLARGRFEHAAKCKRDLASCKLCQTAVTWFATLPPQVLSKALEEQRFR